MTTIPVGRDKEAIVDDDLVSMLTRIPWGSSSGYAVGYPESGGKQVSMHRLIMGFPEQLIDHINRNRLDNRRANLRLVDYSTSNVNRGLLRSNKSGHHGIYWDAREEKWIARVSRRGKRYFIGLFSSLDDAVLHRDEFLVSHSLMKAPI